MLTADDIRGDHAAVDRFWSHVRKDVGCWIWTGGHFHFGHGRMNVRGRARKAHRVSYVLAHGPIPDGQCVLHECDVPACVQPQHLRLGDIRSNHADMTRKRRNHRPAGEKNAMAVLTADAVREIRRRASVGETQESIAALFRTRQGNVSRIVRRTRWAHLS